MCQQSDGQPLAGMIVIGEGQSARAIALSGSSMKMPVLWAKGGTANLHGLNIEVCKFLFFPFFYFSNKKVINLKLNILHLNLYTTLYI